MKYVRIKNKIHAVIEENGYYYKCCYNDESTTLVSKVDNDAYGFPKVLKESNKLEDLCDEFVIDCKLNIKEKPFVYTLPKDIKEYYNSLKMTKDSTIVYGAIWAEGEDGEPILKSVAKMNSEGELELL